MEIAKNFPMRSNLLKYCLAKAQCVLIFCYSLMVHKRVTEHDVAIHAGYHLVEWLNRAAFDMFKRRVEPLPFDAFTGERAPSKTALARIERLIDLARELKIEEDAGKHKREYWDLVHEFDDVMEAYPGVPTWNENLDSEYFGIYADNRGWRRNGEFIAAHCVALLARSGAIERLRQCSCGKWLIAKRQDQQSCSASCRHKLYRQSSGFKENHRLYARWQYQHESGATRLSFEQWKRKEQRNAKKR